MSKLQSFSTQDTQVIPTAVALYPDMDICQTDYPVDWYQDDFVPYAQEYQALPDRKLSTIVPWMEKYIKPAQDYFGEQLMVLAHYYMGGEIVKMVEHFGGEVGDSYQLALKAAENPQKKIIVESAVHFMAESIAILARDDQSVYITNPKAGCTMEMLAKDFMVEPALDALNERYGSDNILPVCYMNTSGRVKALVGAQGGAVCTSSNVKHIFAWARAQKKKIVFIPDQHMGENVAGWLGIDKIAYWPGGQEAVQFNLDHVNAAGLKKFDEAELILFCSYCGVHTYYDPKMVSYWQERGYHVVVHPECRKVTVDVADSYGSTSFIHDQVLGDKAGTKKYAIGTENHLVENLKAQGKSLGIEVVSLGDADVAGLPGVGCGCATMSRNDPPHLVATLDLLRQGKDLSYNLVLPGDVVNEFTGQRQRLDQAGQDWIREHAGIALENMIRIVKG